MTHASATVEHAAFTLRWSFGVDDTPQGQAPTATLRYRVEAHEALYLSDRLWLTDRAGARIADPAGVYRFVHGDTLRLVFDQAPWPSNVELRKTFRPLYSRVAPREARERAITVGLPVDEYSCFARGTDDPATVEHVTRVTLVLGYRLRATLERDADPPPGESGEDAGYIVYDPTRLVSSVTLAPLPVRRRVGYVPRYAFPGEPPPGPRPDAP
mgnify:CR=1 FL=1